MKELGYGAGYAYDPDTAEGFSGADYFPDGIDRVRLYEPTAGGYERQIGERLAHWERLRARRRGTDEPPAGPPEPPGESAPGRQQ